MKDRERDAFTRVAQARIGCSGWSYQGWRGVVYPKGLPTRLWFEFYSEMFDTVELNSTFYRLPSEAAVDHWREQAPEGFCYAVKVGRFGSHQKKLLDPAEWLARHLERATRLGATLGPQLLQLPPRWKCNASRLEEFFAVAPTDMRWAVEFRDTSWLCDNVFEVLLSNNAALCWHDLLPDHPWVRTADFSYVRLHGPTALTSPYGGRYGERGLESVSQRLVEELDAGCDVFVYFNNDIGGASIADATTLKAMVGATN